MFQPPDFPQQGQPIQPGHLKIGDDRTELLVLEAAQRIQAIGCPGGPQPVALEGRDGHLAHPRVVIHDQNRGRLRLRSFWNSRHPCALYQGNLHSTASDRGETQFGCRAAPRGPYAR